MSRRVSLPSADELFRPTAPDDVAVAGPEPAAATVHAIDAPGGDPGDGPVDDGGEAGGKRRPSGRVRHDEKMTVYITSDELLDLEHTRLSLRRSHGLAVDRGRMVREAIAIALADFDQNGDDSVIVQRLRET